ncbi:MAG TPA: hypothetical protein VLA91_06645 [Acidimicrobiia bacterium]|nr:hypothetical protein [Acidimicrobiia bacterium]
MGRGTERERRRSWPSLLLAVAVACGGSSGLTGTVETTTVAPVAATTAPDPATSTAAELVVAADLDDGLPRTGSYSFIDVTIDKAVLAGIEPRTYLLEERLPGPRHLFLGLTVDNTSDTDVANWTPTPFTVRLGDASIGPPQILDGRPNIGLTQRRSTEMVLAFGVPDDIDFDDVMLEVAQPDRIPLSLALVGELPEPGYPTEVDVSGEGPAQSIGVGCRQSLDIEMLSGSTTIDLLGGDYPTEYGSRRARVGERFLTVGLRAHNNGGSRCGGGGTNFGNHDVRLLVDGVPREPVTFVNTTIGADAAADLEFDFVYPVDAAGDLFLTVGAAEATLFSTPVPIPDLSLFPGEG